MSKKVKEQNSLHSVQSDKAKKITWEEFGEQIAEFLDKHGKELRDVDIILGFTKGGMIIATVLCALLRDSFPDFAEKRPYFASLRPLPSGFTAKTYRDPCFVMNSPMDREEEDDAEKLICDIERFRKDYCPTQEKLNLLLVDDNLTGATRLFAYKELLSKRLKYLNIQTLAYTRLECFKHPTLDFVIGGYTSSDKYCVMPWHKIHDPLELPSLKVPLIYFASDTSLDLNELYNKLQKVTGIFGSINTEKDRHIRICRGASVIYIAQKEFGVTMRFLLSKYYPPKRCLELTDITKNVNTFKEYSLCCLGTEKADITCFYCSSLNCNRDILKILLNQNPESNFNVKQLNENTEKSDLNIAVEKWLERFKGSIS